jgi:hypothetical protein
MPFTFQIQYHFSSMYCMLYSIVATRNKLTHIICTGQFSLFNIFFTYFWYW